MKIFVAMILVMSLVALTVSQQDCSGVPHCSSCHNPDIECRLCDAGKIPSETENGCDDCENNCAVCERAEDEGGQQYLECTECLQYHEMTSNGKCLYCGSSCIACQLDSRETGTDCVQCADGYYVNANKGCSVCPTGCTGCSLDGDEVACSRCEANTGLFLTEGQCDSCGAECVVCSSKTECGTCLEGYRLDESKSCVPCETDCGECQINTQTQFEECMMCKHGFVRSRDDITCDECADEHCIECEQKRTECTQCVEGYAVNTQDNSCAACPRFCTECSWSVSKGKTACLQKSCEPGYVRNEQDGDCDECPNRCSVKDNNCAWSVALGKPTCVDCLIDGETFKAWSVTTDRTECRACPDRCEHCDHNSTTNTMICDSCFRGHTMEDSPNDICKVCPDDCNKCKYNTTTETTWCYSNPGCDDGFLYEDDGTCSPCGNDFCKSCDESGCTECMEGYPASPDGQTCYKCQTECDKCKLNPSKDGTVCENENHCDDYYGLNTDGLCVPCDAHCKRCDVDEDSTHCRDNHCDERYVNDKNDNCLSCPENCAECEFDELDGTLCLECDDKYALNEDNGQCLPCTENCGRCIHVVDDNDANRNTLMTSGRVKCDTNQCEPGYGLTSGGLCQDCPGECDVCEIGSDESSCTTCKAGHHRNTNQCSACPRHCGECDHDNGEVSCTQCSPGATYNRETHECVLCSSHCMECIYNVNTLKTDCEEDMCEEGYGRDNRKDCTECSLMFFHCLTCSDSHGDVNDVDDVECLQCQDDFVLADDGTACLVDPTVNCDLAEDRSFICDEGHCDTRHTWVDGVCGAICYTCGGTKNETLLTTCGHEVDNNDVTHDADVCKEQCWAVIMRDSSGSESFARGCGIPDNRDNMTCTDHQNEQCYDVTMPDETLGKECWRCTDENRSNGWELSGGVEKLLSHPVCLLVVMMLSKLLM